MHQQRLIEYIRFRAGFLSIFLNRNHIMRKVIQDAAMDFAEEDAYSILDFGCGTKPYRHLFENAASYTGVDFQNDQIPRPAKDVDIYYDGVNLPFDDNSFDLVISFEVLEHIPNLEQILLEISRVIKPGGKFFFTTPFLYPEHEVPFDYQRLTIYRWINLLEEMGYKVEEYSKEPNDMRSLMQLNLALIFKFINPKDSHILEIIFSPIITIFNFLAYILGLLVRRHGGFHLTNILKARKI